MRRLALLLDALQGPDAEEDAVPLWVRYIAEAPPADAAWGVALIAGRDLGRGASRAVLRDAAIEASGLPPWLFDACAEAAGNMADAIAHAVAPAERSLPMGLAAWIEQRLQPLRDLPARRRAPLLAAWLRDADPDERHLVVSLVGGRMPRTPIASLRRALAQQCGVDEWRIAARLLGWSSGETAPDATSLGALLSRELLPEDAVAPLPFAPPPLPVAAAAVAADSGPWLMRYVRGGVRVQLVRGHDRIGIWSADGDPLTDRMPAAASAAQGLPAATVIEGEWLATAVDAASGFVATDLLRVANRDVRSWPLRYRLAELARTSAGRLTIASADNVADSRGLQVPWARCRALGAEGVLLRRPDESYGAAPWFWPAAPLMVVAALVHLRRERDRCHGDRVVCGFALRSHDGTDAASRGSAADVSVDAGLLPVAEIGLDHTDAAYASIEAAARKHTIRRAGPVRLLEPVFIAELAFDAVDRRARRRSGVALRMARLARVLSGATIADVDTLQRLVDLVTPAGNS